MPAPPPPLTLSLSLSPSPLTVDQLNIIWLLLPFCSTSLVIFRRMRGEGDTGLVDRSSGGHCGCFSFDWGFSCPWPGVSFLCLLSQALLRLLPLFFLCYFMWAHPVPTAILEPSKEAPINCVLSSSSLSSGYFFVLGRLSSLRSPLRV